MASAAVDKLADDYRVEVINRAPPTASRHHRSESEPRGNTAGRNRSEEKKKGANARWFAFFVAPGLLGKFRGRSSYRYVEVEGSAASQCVQTQLFAEKDWIRPSRNLRSCFRAHRGNNDQYLRIRHGVVNPFLQFSTDDIGDETATFEIFTTQDGTLRIKSSYNNKFWRRSPNWIWADSSDETSNNNNNDTLFRPVKVDDQTIALINLGNNHFCKRLTIDGNTDCLNAYVSSITVKAKIKVKEPILSRIIDNVKYDLENSRVYDETVLVLAKNYVANNTQQAPNLDMKLSYTDTRTSTWKTMFSLKLGMKSTMDFSLPLISKGKIELSGEVQSGVEWGETVEVTTILEAVNKIVMPLMTKVTVYLIATKGKCDVPFTFTQRDTLYNGTTVTTEVQGGTYTAAIARFSSVRDGPPMTVTYRLQGLDGEVTMIKELEEEKEESLDPEVEFAIAGVVEECGGLEIILSMIQVDYIHIIDQILFTSNY
ncbi:hypothetical protein J5N97_009189 [Dioscorea zingiberensis]|uniref:Agglutinin domain-containing protein n=1 Tax=Dioscorea zingiberensis TaxID=325984 RepID=A0A9D5CXL2_9LILI|nr:hypothetical protein J5N97_009189 [Dioscorea zingiberensis]